MTKPPLHRGARRALHLALGSLFLLLAVLGALLPLLPTTPFLLVAAWAFARSSPRFEAWLLDHARFGPLIADWRREGAVSVRAKRLSAVVMLVTLGLGAVVGLSFGLLAVQAIVFAAVSLFLWTRPDPSRGPRISEGP